MLVSPARIEREWVPPIEEEAKIGPVRVRRTVREGYYREVPIPPVYKTVERNVEIPAKYQIVQRDVEIPARYERVRKNVELPAEYQEVTRSVVIPGHYEERRVSTPPAVVVEREPGIHIDLDLDKDKKKKRDRDGYRDRD